MTRYLWRCAVVTYGLIFFALAAEELFIIHAPPSVKFTSSEPVHSSYISDIYSALLGYTLPQAVKWNSLAPVNPLKRPEAIFTVELLGFDHKLNLNLDGVHFILENKGDIENQYDIVAFRTQQRFPSKRPVLLHINAANQLHTSKVAQPSLLKPLPAEIGDRLQLALDDSEIGQSVKDHIFNASHPSDSQLLVELATLKALLNALSRQKGLVHDDIPDIYWIKVEGIKPLVDQYGRDSYQVSEGLRLLRQVIAEAKTAVRHIYDDQVILAVLTENDNPMPFVRRSRNLLETTEIGELGGTSANRTQYNLANQWDPMFPVVFAMTAFLVILITLSVLGVAVAMWNMDPGRDSIIYRMTSQRMKKD